MKVLNALNLFTLLYVRHLTTVVVLWLYISLSNHLLLVLAVLLSFIYTYNLCHTKFSTISPTYILTLRQYFYSFVILYVE